MLNQCFENNNGHVHGDDNFEDGSMMMTMNTNNVVTGPAMSRN